MAKLQIKYRTEGNALPPRPIRVSLPGWGGEPSMKKENGSQPQPWHCPLHTEGATHGVELLYHHEAECHVINDAGKIRFEWDASVGPIEFTLSVPPPPQNYLFPTSIDLQAPPGYVLRTEPHPRFFADTTGTVPAAVYGHVRSEWWPKKLFIVFKIPEPGQRHIFRKGEPYVQVLFIPDDDYELTKMNPEEEAHRRKLDDMIRVSKSLIAKNVWHSAGGVEFNDHYKVLSRAFEREGVAGVESTVRQAFDRYKACVPRGMTAAEAFRSAARYQSEGKHIEAKEVLHYVMRNEPRNAEAYNRIGLLEWDIGVQEDAVRSMSKAIALDPTSAQYQTNLGEFQRRLGRYKEAEASFDAALQLAPNVPEVMGLLGYAIALSGRVDEGLERIQQATTINPKAADPHFRMGVILAKQGRTAEARACYETVLKLDPRFTPARDALNELPAEASPS